MGEYRIEDTSPCKDTGNNGDLPADVADVDWDANTIETLPRDLKLSARKVVVAVDMGAYEASVGGGSQ